MSESNIGYLDVRNDKHRDWLRRFGLVMGQKGVHILGAYESPSFDGYTVWGSVGLLNVPFLVALRTIEGGHESPYYFAMRCVRGMDDTWWAIDERNKRIEALKTELDGGI